MKFWKNKRLVEKHLELFIKYWLTLDLINQITKDNNYFESRTGLKEFFEYFRSKNIELLIFFSWISNFITSFLEQN